MPRDMGIIPTTVVPALIRIGLRRRDPACTRASSRPMIFLFWLMNSTNRMELLTTVPTSTISPRKDIMDREVLVMNSARKAPLMAKGIAMTTMKGMVIDSNWAARMRKTKRIATTSAVSRSPNTSIICSSSPPVLM